MLIKLIITGYLILIIAILANLFANTIGVCTWHEFINNLIQQGISKSILFNNLFNLLWLFFIYPIILGLSGWLGQLACNAIIK